MTSHTCSRRVPSCPQLWRSPFFCGRWQVAVVPAEVLHAAWPASGEELAPTCWSYVWRVSVCERFWSFHLNTSDKSIYRVYKTGSATPTCTAFRLSLMCILSTSDSGTCKKKQGYPWLQGIHGYKVSMVLISLLGEWQLRYHIHIVCSFPRTKKTFSDWLVIIQMWHVKNAIKCGNITSSSDLKNCIRPSDWRRRTNFK